MKVVVVGAGVMGSASALELANAGIDVLLVERAVPGAEASSAAAGMLGAQLESHGPGGDYALFLKARDEYGAWADELRRETGVDVGYRVSGALELAFDEMAAEKLRANVAWQAKQTKERARAELLDRDAALSIEPALAPTLVAAAFYPDEAQVEPPRLLRAISVAVARHPRIALRSGATVKSVVFDKGRARGVKLEEGEILGDAVVLAAGSWSSLVGGLEGVVPEVRPARGQLLELEERPVRLRTIVAGGGGYVVPRGDGRVVCGTTLEFVGFRREVTADGIRSILDRALNLVPGLGVASFTTAWSSFRPFSTTERPLVGKSEAPGLVLATGHHRNGILLAKVTAQAVKAAVVDSLQNR
jgi:glycine oxidase